MELNRILSILAVCAFKVFNKLHGYDILSASKIAKGYSEPIDYSFLPQYTPDGLLARRPKSKAKRKSTNMVRSDPGSEKAVK